MIAGGRGRGRAARRAHRDVLDRLLDGDRAHRRAARRPERAVPRRAGASRTACGCAARCPSAPTTPTAAVNRFVLAGPDGERSTATTRSIRSRYGARARALRGRRRARDGRRRGRPRRACSSATTCASPTSSGRWPRHRLLRRRRQLARGAPRPLARAAAGACDREPGVRRRRQPRRARRRRGRHGSSTRVTACIVDPLGEPVDEAGADETILRRRRRPGACRRGAGRVPVPRRPPLIVEDLI